MPLPLAGYAVSSERSQQVAIPVEAPAPLRIWHLASFDAPTVAVVWTLSFAQAADVHLPLWVPVLIAIGTWFVYVGDRILDAGRAIRSGQFDALRDRHFFHWRHRRVLLPLAVLAAMGSVALIFGVMPAITREHDSVLALAALAYFSGIHAPGSQPRWMARLRSKEMLVGVLFTAGCALPTLTRLHAAAWDRAAILIVMGSFAALAWLNCAAIDRWETGGASSIGKPALCIGIVICLVTVACAAFSPHVAGLAAACAGSALMIGLLDRSRQRLTPLLLRCAADVVLLTPLFCVMR